MKSRGREAIIRSQALIVTILVDTIQALDLKWPEVTEQEHKANLEARKRLELEP